MLVHDNEVSILFNIIKDNCMAGVVSRNTSRASILFNVFDKNQFDIVAEQDHALLAGI